MHGARPARSTRRPDGGMATEFVVDPAKFHDVFAADLPAARRPSWRRRSGRSPMPAFADGHGRRPGRTCRPGRSSRPATGGRHRPRPRSMAERAGATITELDGSHVIMISQPQAVTDVILEAVGRRRARQPIGAVGDVARPRHRAFAGRSRQIDAGVLDVGYVEPARRTDQPVVLLHGWPYDIHSYAEVAPAARRGGLPGDRAVPARATARRGSSGHAAQRGAGGPRLDVIALMDALEIETAIIAGFDWGARTAGVVAALWPERVQGARLGQRLPDRQPAANRSRCHRGRARLVVPVLFRHGTRPGRLRRSTAAVRQADLAHRVAAVGLRRRNVRSERGRRSTTPTTSTSSSTTTAGGLGLADGEAQYEDLETAARAAPAIAVPTITLEGDANGAPHPEPGAYERSSAARTRTGHPAASVTTCRRKRRGRSPSGHRRRPILRRGHEQLGRWT